MIANVGSQNDGPDENGLYSFIDAIALTADRSTVLYSVCCEPVAGSVHAIPIGGGEAQFIMDGHAPAPSPTSDAVARIDPSVGVLISPVVVQDPATVSVIASSPSELELRTLAWSPSGSLLAVELASRDVVVLPPTASDLSEGTVLTSPGGDTIYSPVFVADDRLAVIERSSLGTSITAIGIDPSELRPFRIESDVDLADIAVDTSGQWLIALGIDGSLTRISTDGSQRQVVGSYPGATQVAW